MSLKENLFLSLTQSILWEDQGNVTSLRISGNVLNRKWKE